MAFVFAALAAAAGPFAGATFADPAAPAAGPPLVQVDTVDHERLRGALLAVGEDEISLGVDAQTVRLPRKKLLAVAVVGPAAREDEKPTATVELTDRSLLTASEVVVKAGNARITLAAGGRVDVSTRIVRWIHFQAPGEATDATRADWDAMLAVKSAADLLVVRKRSSLDYLEGVAQDVGPEELQFMVDKEVASVKRAKVEGLIYYHAAGDKPADALCDVALLGATRLAIRKISLADGQFHLTTVAGMEWTGPAEQVRELDFSAGKVRYLSDLEPSVVQYTPFFAPKEPIESWNEYFRMRRDRGPEPGPLRLGGKTYQKGLSLHSRSHVAYRLPGEFNRFEALVGIDGQAGDRGAARVRISSENKTLWEDQVRAGDAPRQVSVSVAKVRRLDIVVDFGDDLDIGDFVDLCEARVTK